MIYIRSIIFIIFLYSIPSQASANYNISSFDSKKRLSNQSYLRLFPYEKYLEKTVFSNIQQLEKDRIFLQKTRGIGDDFLYYLSENFIKLYPPRFSYIDKSIGIGEKFISYSLKKGYRKNDVYVMIGYFILGKCGNYLEKYANKNYGKSKNKIDRLKLRLEKNNIYIKIKLSSFDKLWDNLKNGNIEYIFDRLFKKIKSFFQEEKSSKITLAPIKENMFNMYRNNIHIGHVIFLDRKKYRAHYMANSSKGNSVFKKYVRYLKTRKKISKLVTSGGFSNSLKQPEGLTIDKGTIVNAILMPERHGLIIVQKDGGIRAINLKRKNFTLPISRNIASRKLTPLKSLVDYSYLINWMKKNNITAFQTQLLAYSNKMLIDVNLAKNQIRERRFLILASKDNPRREVQHIIVNIEYGMNLAIAAKDIFDMVKYRKFKVEAIMNLDVGTYNILEAYSNSGKKTISAPVPISDATNLLFYTK